MDLNKIKDFIRSHEMIQQMTKDLKVLKSAKRELEADIAQYLSEISIDVIDASQYRIYKYDQRLVIYKRSFKTSG